MENVLGFRNMGSVQLFDKNSEDNLWRNIVVGHILNTSKQMGSFLCHSKVNVFKLYIHDPKTLILDNRSIYRLCMIYNLCLLQCEEFPHPLWFSPHCNKILVQFFLIHSSLIWPYPPRTPRVRCCGQLQGLTRD